MRVCHGLFFLLQAASCITVSENTTKVGSIDLSIGDIVIDSNVYWSIWNSAFSSFTGSLRASEDAGFYISANTITLNILLLGVTNSDGIISFNSLGSSLAPTFNLVGSSFNNHGEIYFAADGTGLMSILGIIWDIYLL